MEKKIIFKPLLIVLLFLGFGITHVTAQCCNVFASNGNPVISPDGTCVSLTYPTTACADDYTLNISVEVWMLFYTALADVYFATDSDSLTGDSYRALDKIASLMQNGRFILKLSGYADSTGTGSYNQDLSLRRAVAVRDYLWRKGVSRKRIVLAAYGERMPKMPNSTSQGRAANRRVEFDLYY